MGVNVYCISFPFSVVNFRFFVALHKDFEFYAGPSERSVLITEEGPLVKEK